MIRKLTILILFMIFSFNSFSYPFKKLPDNLKNYLNENYTEINNFKCERYQDYDGYIYIISFKMNGLITSIIAKNDGSFISRIEQQILPNNLPDNIKNSLKGCEIKYAIKIVEDRQINYYLSYNKGNYHFDTTFDSNGSVLCNISDNDGNNKLIGGILTVVIFLLFFSTL